MKMNQIENWRTTDFSKLSDKDLIELVNDITNNSLPYPMKIRLEHERRFPNQYT